MSWLKSCLSWIAGAVFALAFMYLTGRRDGKHAEEKKQKDKVLHFSFVAKRIDDLSDDAVDRLPSKYD